MRDKEYAFAQGSPAERDGVAIIRQVLVFGGSFDPPHRGHLALLLAAAKNIRPDRIVIVPAWHAPLKEAPSASASDRLRMIRLGLKLPLPVRWKHRTRIDDYEIKLGRRVYTVETLRRLDQRHPRARIHFLVGSDAAATFGSWRKPAELKARATWWTGRRSGAAGAAAAHFHRLPGLFPDISSSGIRSSLALGRDIQAEIDPGVFAYIQRKGLYGLDILIKLAASLSSERYAHSLAVAELAAELAARWGFDVSKAGRAGILHDCGRAISVPSLPAYARRWKLRVPALAETARNAPLLLHAYAGSDLARRRFGVSDRGILSAIRHHTLGSPSMNSLDRLLYVADACSRDRTYPSARRLRELAFADLGRAFRATVRNKLDTARSNGAWIHPITRQLWRARK